MAWTTICRWFDIMSKPSDPTLAPIADHKGSDKVSCDTKAGTESFDAVAFEQDNVHTVYQAIATHFSDTRYKPWPLVSSFLHSMSTGAVGADLGCGNGKYLGVNSLLTEPTTRSEHPHQAPLLTIGMDRSSNLIDLAQRNFGNAGESSSHYQRHEVGVADALRSGLRSASLDYALSIATIHHFASRQRRIDAVREMIRIVRPVVSAERLVKPSFTDDESKTGQTYPGLGNGSGRFLIVVWALEQRGESRRQFEQVAGAQQVDESEKNQASAPQQDLLVPWILKKNAAKGKANRAESPVPASLDPAAPQIFQRFYHVFKQGELENIVEEAAKTFDGLTVEQEIDGWEKGNWYGIWRCVAR